MDYIILYALAAGLLLLSALKDPVKTRQALKKSLKAIEKIFPQLLTVIMLVALTLAVFEPALISRLLGEESGIFGGLAAAVIGAITLVPGFVAFPAAAELLANGAGVFQVAAFLTALMMVGIVTLPMEITYFGRKIALIRNGLAFLFVFAAAAFVAWANGI